MKSFGDESGDAWTDVDVDVDVDVEFCDEFGAAWTDRQGPMIKKDREM